MSYDYLHNQAVGVSGRGSTERRSNVIQLGDQIFQLGSKDLRDIERSARLATQKTEIRAPFAGFGSILPIQQTYSDVLVDPMTTATWEGLKAYIADKASPYLQSVKDAVTPTIQQASDAATGIVAKSVDEELKKRTGQIAMMGLVYLMAVTAVFYFFFYRKGRGRSRGSRGRRRR